MTRIDELINLNIDKLEARQNSNKEFRGLKTGFSQLDRLLYGFNDSNLIVLGARPGMGKTAFAMNVTRNILTYNPNKSACFFSLHESGKDLTRKLICAEARINTDELNRGTTSEETWGNVAEACGILSEKNLNIDDVTENISDIIDVIDHKNYDFVVIDSIEMINGWNQDATTRSEIVRKFKQIAKRFEIPVLVTCQISKELEQRADKRPMLYDFSSSHSLVEIADTVMAIYRDEMYNRDPNNSNKGFVEITVLKNRYGSVGTVHFVFIAKYNRFENPNLKDYEDTV